MITNELLQFLKVQREKGMSDDKIKAALIGNGWSAADVEEGYRALAGVVASKPVDTSEVTEATEAIKAGKSSMVVSVYICLMVFSFINQSAALANILFYVDIALGIAAAGILGGWLIKWGRGKHVLVRALTVLVAVAGGVAIFAISFISGFINIFRITPPNGD